MGPKTKGKAATRQASASADEEEDEEEDEDEPPQPSTSLSTQTPHRFDGFNDTQMQQITQALQQIYLRNTPAPPTPPPARPTPPARPLSITNPPANPPSSRLRAADIGYFDPHGVDTTGKIVIYTDVFAFTDMLLHLAETQSQADDIRTAFPLCLRGTALFWYSTELTLLERSLLSAASVSTLCTSLISRFKERPGIALRALISSRFTFSDIRSGKTIRTHVQEMLRFARSSGFENEFNTLLLIHNSLDTPLRGHINEPTETTTLSQFLNAIDAKWSLWLDMAHRAPWPRQNLNQNQNLLPGLPEPPINTTQPLNSAPQDSPATRDYYRKPNHRARAYQVEAEEETYAPSSSGPSPANLWYQNFVEQEEKRVEELVQGVG
jgi:hypothetical protein